jgi:hypothetical protein
MGYVASAAARVTNDEDVRRTKVDRACMSNELYIYSLSRVNACELINRS